MENNKRQTSEPSAESFSYFEDVGALVGAIAPDTIVSRTFLKRDGTHFIIFGFAPGQKVKSCSRAACSTCQSVRG